MKKEFISQVAGGPVAGAADLAELSTVQLAALHREITGRAAARFEGREQALSAVLSALEGALNPSAGPRKIRVGRRYRILNHVPPAGMKLRPPRDGTMLRQMVELLSRPEGATLADLVTALRKPRQTVLRKFQEIMKNCGYGLSEDEAGNIRIHDSRRCP